MVISSNPALRAMGEEMLPSLVRLSALELESPIRIEERSRAQLEEFLRLQMEKEFPEGRAAQLVQSYALLGMMEEGLDLEALLRSVLLEQVAGFYDPNSTTLYVLDDQAPELVRSILMHELVHAVQDQHMQLSALTDQDMGNDRLVAAKSALEGHATLVMIGYILEQTTGGPLNVAAIPDFSGAGGLGLQALGAQFPSLDAAPLILREALVFPYLGGMSFTRALWRDAGVPVAPLGERLPRSTEQVLRPERFLAPEPDEPTELALEGAAAPTYQNSLGALEVAVMLEELLGAEARSLAQGWDGDRFGLFGTGPGSSLVWFSVWDDEGSRDAFLGGVSGALGGLPRPAEIGPTDIGGRPGIVLRVGDPPATEARIDTRGGDAPAP